MALSTLRKIDFILAQYCLVIIALFYENGYRWKVLGSM